MQINQKITIKVAEPWDFTSPEGDNIFSGIVQDYINSVNGQVFLIKNSRAFTINGTIVKYVVAMYRNKKIDSEHLNIAIISEDAVPQFQNIIKDQLKFIIIGSLT